MIPSVAASGEAIYRGRVPSDEIEQRLETCWRPYTWRCRCWSSRPTGCLAAPAARCPFHALVSVGHRPARTRPAHRYRAGRQSRRGLRCHLVDCAERWLVARGLRVRRNQPYAGGFTTQRYGRPSLGRHTLQIELNRAFYMDEARHEKLPGFATTQALMAGLLEELARAALETLLPRPLAARSAPRSKRGEAKKRGRDKHGPSLGRKRPRRAYSKQRGRRGDVCCPQRMVHLRRECKRQKEPLIHRLSSFFQM